jgi:hypothetical protein
MEQVLIGGTGHSGTRALVEIIEALGVWFPDGGPTRDSPPFCHLSRDTDGKHMRSLAFQYYRSWAANETPPSKHGHDPELYCDLYDAVTLGLRDMMDVMPTGRTLWGAKLPQFIMILPILHEMFPYMRFVHIVRHCLRFPNHLQWAQSNSLAFDYGMREMHPDYRYLLVRYEDLCEDPTSVITRLKGYLNVEGDDDLSHLVRRSDNREYRVFHTARQLLGTGVHPDAVEVMRDFGYLEA